MGTGNLLSLKCVACKDPLFEGWFIKFGAMVYEVDTNLNSRDAASMIESVELVEPRVRDLKDEALRNLRVVMRNLSELRRITGIGEVVNLGKFIHEVGLEGNSDAPADPRQLQATEQGAVVRRKLIAAEGGSLSAEDAAQMLGMSKVALLKRYRRGRLVAWREERQNAFRFPRWQFQNDRVLPGLEDVLTKLNEGGRLDDFGRMLFFLSNMGFLKGKRPLDCLREGAVHKAVQAAQGYGCQ